MTNQITRRWVNEHGEGHWVYSNGYSEMHVDDSELDMKEAEEVLSKELKEKESE